MSYTSVSLDEIFKINNLYTIHYFEYMSDFSFEGESHNFWEFCFVDKGEVGITTSTATTILKKGDIAFHQPNEFHNVKANGQIAPNLVVVSFGCDSHHMKFFKNKILRVDELERNLLANIIIEARNCFDSRLDDPYMQQMVKKEHADAFAAEQLIRLYLEQFLIHMVRRYSNPVVIHKKISTNIPKSTKIKSDDEVFNRVIDYLETNISAHVTIEQICRDNLVGRSQLQKIFRDKSGLGIIEYFSKMKIDTAKQLIRTNRMNFTQISEKLGYTSIHYFSRQFKKITNMTPSEYASSIRVLADGRFK
ncbi:MAG: AraC family transcriptional regulator [Lachnospiraceae bacterium]